MPESKVDLVGSAFRQKKFYVSDIFDSRTLQDATHVYISLSDAGALFGSESRVACMRGSRICLIQAHCGRIFQPDHKVYSITNWFSTNGIYSSDRSSKLTMSVVVALDSGRGL